MVLTHIPQVGREFLVFYWAISTSDTSIRSSCFVHPDAKSLGFFRRFCCRVNSLNFWVKTGRFVQKCANFTLPKKQGSEQLLGLNSLYIQIKSQFDGSREP